MAKLNCPQLNRVIEYDPNFSVMKNLLKKNIPVASSCGGDGICGKCRMKVFSSDNLPLPSDLEKMTLKRNNATAAERLSCQLYIKTDATVETTYW